MHVQTPHDRSKPRASRRYALMSGPMGSLMLPLLAPMFGLSVLSSNTVAQSSITNLFVLPGGSWSYATDVSVNGGVVTVVGVADDSTTQRAFRWTLSGGMQGLPPNGVYSQAYAISSDGAVIAGHMTLPTHFHAVRWVGTGAPQDLQTLPGAVSSEASALSADGSIVAGSVSDGSSRLAFRWTSSSGVMQVLGALPGFSDSGCIGLSSDGGIAVGYSRLGTSLTRATMWNGSAIQALGTLPGHTQSGASGASADGSVIVGGSSSGTVASERAFIWTPLGGMVNLGVLPGHVYSSAECVSADGSTVFGFCSSPAGDSAFMWTATYGMVDLNAYLPTIGVNLSGWRLEDATSISDDGTALVGYGTFNGETRAWLVRLDASVDVLDGADYASWSFPHDIVPDTSVPRRPGVARIGACADGSRLVFRCRSATPGEFRARFVAPGVGSGNGALAVPLGAYDEVAPAVAPTSQVGSYLQHDAIIAYRAPVDYVPANDPTHSTTASRAVSVFIEFRPLGAASWQQIRTLALSIRRPPVILAHGLWSEAETWKPVLRGPLEALTLVTVMDYKSTNHAEFAVNAQRVRPIIEKALEEMRSLSIAATRVDWVGHSMGGILPRVYYERARRGLGGFWRRRDNFGEGDVHKLILLNSPQHGAPFANVVWDVRNVGVLPLLTISEGFAAFGKPIGGAVRDLRVGSQALAAIGITPIPSATIVGTGGAAALGTASSPLSTMGALLGEPFESAFALVGKCVTGATSGVLFGGQNHDLIVPQDSQQAGLGPPGVTPYVAAVSDATSLHTRVTGSASYVTPLLQLLNERVALLAPALPAPAQTVPTTLGSTWNVTSSTITIVNQPPYNQTPGQVHLTAGGVAGFSPQSVEFICRWGSWVATQPPFSVVFQAPPGDIAPLEVLVLASDGSGALAQPAMIVANPVTPGALLGLEVEEAELRLLAPLQSVPLSVMGLFATGSMNLTGAASGTTYVSSDTAVAAVTSDGVVTAMAPGHAVITITNSGHQAAAQVTVRYDPVVGYGSATAGSGNAIPVIDTDSELPSCGNSNFRIRCTDVAGGAPGVMIASGAPNYFVFGANEVWVDLTGSLFLGIVANGTSGQPAAGTAFYPLPIPAVPSLAGLRVHWQAAFLDPGAPAGLSSSWGLVTTIVR